MSTMFSFLSGLVFSIGLVISGMINPKKVIGFLDIFGQWDYSLAFVMGGAVVFNLVSFKLLKKKSSPLFTKEFNLPTAVKIDRSLIIGSALFGVGWGIAGICPGPGIVNIVTLEPKVLVFIISMIVGMIGFKMAQSR